MSNQKKELQHYVPRFYLRQFSKNKKTIECLQKITPYEISPLEIKNVASEKYFYDNDLPQPLENYLSNLENEHSQIYRKIVKSHSLSYITYEDKQEYADYIYLQYIRTDYMRTKIFHIYAYEIESRKTEYIKNKGYDWYIKFKNKVLNESYIQAQRYLITLDDSILSKLNIELKTNIINILKSRIKDRLRNHLKKLKWLLFNIKETDYQFYTSDQPIVFYNTSNQYNNNGLTFLNIYDSNTQIFYPLHPQLCLILYYPLRNKIKMQNLIINDFDSIKKINQLITHEAKKFIFSENGDFSIALDYLKTHPEIGDINIRRFMK